MQITVFILALAGMATAGPAARRTSKPSKQDQMTVQQAIDACGNNLELNCCNSKTEESDGNGLLGLLDGLSLFDGCSKLGVTALIGVDDLLNSQCKQNVACCDHSNSQASNGLINVGLPCVALGSLL